MSASQVIANYESLSALTGKMRDAAVNGKWEELVSLEHQSGELVSVMKIIDAEINLDEPARAYKAQLINKILADETEVRKLTEVWMIELQGILQSIEQSNRQEQRLQNTYGV